MSLNTHNAFAQNYDQAFTNTLVGKRQRSNVWNVLNKYLKTSDNVQILELNGGTGEDAIHFAELGHHVICTDISNEMLELGRLKQQSTQKTLNLRFQQLDIKKLQEDDFNQKFDIVFSNFGGLNCLSPEELKVFSSKLTTILNPNGIFIAVVMPSFCLLEKVYFLLKFNFKKIFEKSDHQYIDININNHIIRTWFYTPNTFLSFFNQYFKEEKRQLIGLVPSYLNAFFMKNQGLFKRIISLENNLIKQKKGAAIADHYLIILRLK